MGGWCYRGSRPPGAAGRQSSRELDAQRLEVRERGSAGVGECARQPVAWRFGSRRRSDPALPLSRPAAIGRLKPCEHRTSTGRRRIPWRWVGRGSRGPRWRCGNFWAVTRRGYPPEAGGERAAAGGSRTGYGGGWRMCGRPVAGASVPVCPDMGRASACLVPGKGPDPAWPLSWPAAVGRPKPCEHRTPTGRRRVPW